MWDIFNRKKISKLQKDLQDERHNNIAMASYYRGELERLEDHICMMDDELCQVARGRYMNKYIKIPSAGNEFAVFHVTDVDSEFGQIRFKTDRMIMLNSKGEGMRIYDSGQANLMLDNTKITLSHLHTVGEVIRAGEFRKIENECINK